MTGSKALSITAHSSSPSTHCREQPGGRMGEARQFLKRGQGERVLTGRGQGAYSGCQGALVPRKRPRGYIQALCGDWVPYLSADTRA